MGEDQSALHKASQSQVDDLVASNMLRIQKNIGLLVSRKLPTQKFLVAMSFDEMATKNNLTKMITEAFSQRAEKAENTYNTDNIYDIADHFNEYVDLTKEEFYKMIDEKVTTVQWNPTFKPFLQNLMVNPVFFPVIVSSGIKGAITKALESIGAAKRLHVFSNEMEYNPEGVIVGAHLIIGDVEKGRIVENLAQLGSFDRVVTVGHARGDVNFIRAGTPGLRFSFVGDQFAMSAADHTVTTWTEIISYLNTDL
ncbi:hypothetical protein KC614_02625 [candidate division WWE3 bacterium]|uniref:5'-nucleotidase n=1 Tax=candidate division WWE3 bacterium TaxID=2053526 RepID=A0A955LKC5_UNCKA|nr:hypothetical protein [candidate division WWE3 bacterium]